MNFAFIIILILSDIALSKNIVYYSDHNPKQAQCLPEVLAAFLGHRETKTFEPFKENAFVKEVCPNLSFSCCREEDVRFLLDQFNLAKKKLVELDTLNKIAINIYKDINTDKMREFLEANRSPGVDKCIGEELKYAANLTTTYLDKDITSGYLNLALNGIYEYYASFICEICSLDVYTYLDNPLDPASIRFNKSNYKIAFHSIAYLMYYHKRIYPMYQIAKVGLCLQDPDYTPLDIERKTLDEIELDRSDSQNCYNLLPGSFSLGCLKRSAVWGEFSNNTITSNYFLYLQRIILGLNVMKIQQIQFSQSLKSSTNAQLLKGVIEFYERNERSEFSFDSLTIELVEDKAWDIEKNKMNPKFWKYGLIFQIGFALIVLLSLFG